MDDNTKEVLVLAITTLSTVGVAWIRMRGVRHMQTPPPSSPATPTPPTSGGTPGV